MADAPVLPDLPRPSQLWKNLDAEKKRLAADAFWRDEHAANEQAEAIGLIAQRIKFRLKSVVGLPVEKKSHYLLSMPRTISRTVSVRRAAHPSAVVIHSTVVCLERQTLTLASGSSASAPQVSGSCHTRVDRYKDTSGAG